MNASIVVFDVNETLTDMSPMGQKFVEVGAPAYLAKLWFAMLLRDGFALAASGDSAAFATIGAEALRGIFTGMALKIDIESAVQHVMTGFTGLGLHPDAIEGINALHAADYRLATLTNGSTAAHKKLFEDTGILDKFEMLLSVEDASAWKPRRAAYDYAASACHSTPDKMLLVAVHPWDIHGASCAGLATAWINRTGAPYPGYFRAPDHTVTSLTELTAVLMKN